MRREYRSESVEPLLREGPEVGIAAGAEVELGLNRWGVWSCRYS